MKSQVRIKMNAGSFNVFLTSPSNVSVFDPTIACDVRVNIETLFDVGRPALPFTYCRSVMKDQTDADMVDLLRSG